MVVHVLPALKKYAGFENQDQKYFVLAFSVETASYLPNIYSTFTPRNLPPHPRLAICPDKPLMAQLPLCGQ